VAAFAPKRISDRLADSITAAAEEHSAAASPESALPGRAKICTAA
jgi:hypothetical protein